MVRNILYLISSLILFFISGCDNSTISEKYPIVEGTNERYLYNRFEKNLLVYDTSLSQVTKRNIQNNFIQYEFPNSTNIYTSGHSYENNFEIIKVGKRDIEVLLKVGENEAIFPVANTDSYYIMSHYFYDNSGINEIEESRKLCLFDVNKKTLHEYEQVSGLITKGVIQDYFLYYMVYNKSGDLFDLYRLDLRDYVNEPSLEQTDLISDDLLLTIEGLWLSDETQFYHIESQRTLPKGSENYIHPNQIHLVQIMVNKESVLSLKVWDTMTQTLITEIDDIVDFEMNEEEIVVYGNGFIERVDLS